MARTAGTMKKCLSLLRGCRVHHMLHTMAGFEKSMSQQRKDHDTPLEYKERQNRRPITTASNLPLLYVDGLNFMFQFLCDSVDMLSTLKTAEMNIALFMRQANFSE